MATSSRRRAERRTPESRIPDLSALVAPLVALARARLAAPLLYIELAGHEQGIASREARRDCRRSIATAVRQAAGSVLRKNDPLAAGPGAHWFVALLVDRAVAAPARREVDEAGLGAIAVRLRDRCTQALQIGKRAGTIPSKASVLCGWSVVDPVDAARPLVELRQAIRGAALIAHLEAQRALVLAAVTHELRTPLTSIIGYAERLTDSPIPQEQRARYCDVIASEARRLHRLVEGLIDIGAWNAGKIILRRESVSLRSLTKHAWDAVAPSAGARRLTLALTGDAQAIIDRERVQQVLVNVLENAARHAPPGSAIAIRIGAAAGRAKLTIVDRGKGFEMRVRRAFGLPFEPGTNGRVGLGLAISRVLVEAHGGVMKVGGSRGGRVTIELPESVGREFGVLFTANS